MKMKKVLFPILALVLVLALALPMAAVGAHTEASPQTVVLVADGGSEATHVDVGTVSVWNDTENLYVKYETIDGWEMTATHLEVATSEEDIPQTKKTGNPKVGKFTYKMEHDPAATSYTYAIPLDGWMLLGIPLAIAAHADVVQPTDEWETVWQIGDVEVVNGGTGWLENYADEFNWGDPAGPITMGPGLNASQPAFTDPFIVGTTSPNEFPYNSNTVKNYATDFDVQWSGSLPFGGKLTVSWSPGQSANETKVVGDGISTTSFSATGTPSSGEGWFMDKYPLVEHEVSINPLSDGVHTINFQHTEGDGTFWDWVRLEKPIEQEETAWGGWHDGTRFTDKGNWATWFTYKVQPELATYGTATAEWSSEESNTGDYSWKLHVPDGEEDMAAVVFDVDIALEDITTLSFYKMVTSYGASGWNPSVILLIDANNDGDLDFDIDGAMAWHFTWSGLGDDAFVELESPLPLTSIETTWTQLDAFAMSAWGADDSGFLYGTGGYNAGLTGFQSGGSYGVIDPSDKVLMVAIVIGGAGSWMDETAYIDDVVIAGP